jgi:hypothetical protein
LPTGFVVHSLQIAADMHLVHASLGDKNPGGILLPLFISTALE